MAFFFGINKEVLPLKVKTLHNCILIYNVRTLEADKETKTQDCMEPPKSC